MIATIIVVSLFIAFGLFIGISLRVLSVMLVVSAVVYATVAYSPLALVLLLVYFGIRSVMDLFR
jgi:hypothetical protein